MVVLYFNNLSDIPKSIRKNGKQYEQITSNTLFYMKTNLKIKYIYIFYPSLK